MDRSYLISLVRRQDRRSLALAEFEKVKITPHLFYGVDGRLAQLPKGWPYNRGIYGCLRSHLSVLDDAIRNEYDWFAVYEDDVVFLDSFVADFRTLFSAVPSDWDAVMLGGEHTQPPTQAGPGVVRCTHALRTHAYVVRGRYAKTLRDVWRSRWGYLDWMWAANHARHKVYAPEKWICGQRAGVSDIDGNTHQERFFYDTTCGTNH